MCVLPMLVQMRMDVFTLAGYLLTLFKKKKKGFQGQKKMHYGDLGEFFQGPQETSIHAQCCPAQGSWPRLATCPQVAFNVPSLVPLKYPSYKGP